MNKTALRSVATLAIALSLTGCGENAWNDHLEGFEVPPVSSKTESVAYTLTAADYATLAGLTDNKSLASSNGQAAALSAIGKNGYFSTEEEARLYLPAFLANSGFPYFSANNGSSIKVTYKVAESRPSDLEAISKATEYRVNENQYQAAWESTDDYIEAFAPMNPAASHLPSILKSSFPDAVNGQFVVVNYNQATTNPIFGSVNGGENEWTPTSVIKNVAVGDELNIRGIVTGVSTRGFVVTDEAGSICYDQGNGFNDAAITVGAMVNVKGGVTAYSRCLQITTDASYEVVGTQNYTYPTPTVYNAAMIDEACNATGDMLAQYIKVTGKVSVSGNYVNLSFEGTEQAGSVYNAPDYIKALLKDGEEVTLEGYFVAVTGKAKYFNLLVTSVNGTKPAPSAKSAQTRSVVGTLETVAMNAIYSFNGSKWVVPSNTVILQPADYAAMGQKYGNLSGTLPATLLPKYMQANHPYAAEGDMMTVVYKYYDGAATSFRTDGMVVSDGQWVVNNYQTEATDQFNKLNNKWQFDPSVKMTLTAGRGQAFSATYYQACVDWVYKNIDIPLGSTDIKSGIGYVTTYGNNEYYSGASAYQNNVDLRASAALAQYAAGYAGKTDEEIVELMKYHFCYEVFPGALSALHGDAKPVEGIDVLYTVNFSAYTGTATTEYTGIWKVVGQGKFQFVSCNWWADGVSSLAK